VPLWSIVAAVYGGVLTATALVASIGRRPTTVTACVAYTLVAIGAGTMPPAPATTLVAPAVLLLAGYWLSGLFFRRPQPWLERWLMATDAATGVSTWPTRLPRIALEVLEAAYAAVHLVVAGGAILAVSTGLPAIERYWNVVLTAELACYVALPFLRSRPPRSLAVAVGLQTSQEEKSPLMRRVNVALLNRASVQANTLPSGHVAGAVAAALATWSVAPVAGVALLAVAGGIAVGAFVGRYHYGVDCVAGAVVAVVAWSLF
jgi:hypothetical protein